MILRGMAKPHMLCGMPNVPSVLLLTPLVMLTTMAAPDARSRPNRSPKLTVFLTTIFDHLSLFSACNIYTDGGTYLSTNAQEKLLTLYAYCCQSLNTTAWHATDY